MNNNVESPRYYNSHPSGIECIEIVRHMNFNCGSAIKYLWRAGLKEGNPNTQDIEKAIWYLKDEARRLNGGVELAERYDMELVAIPESVRNFFWDLPTSRRCELGKEISKSITAIIEAERGR